MQLSGRRNPFPCFGVESLYVHIHTYKHASTTFHVKHFGPY
jgi:hypothetical protein